MNDRLLHAAAWSLLLGSIIVQSGCAPVNLRGNGFGDNTANWGQKFRPPTEPGSGLGFDKRAQEIEQNLGVR